MLLSEIFEQLAYGELANTILGGDDQQETIPSDKYIKVIPAINAALDALHARFELRTNSVLLMQSADTTEYTLSRKFAYTNNLSTASFKYLRDTNEKPFIDDVIRIDRIVDSEGCPVYINDESKCSSVYLPMFDTIEFPKTSEGALFNVIYQAKHPKLIMTGDVLNQLVNIPVAYLDALLAYVGYRIYKNRKSLTSESPSNNYYGIYQAECARFENKSPINTISSTKQVGDSGWV